MGKAAKEYRRRMVAERKAARAFPGVVVRARAAFYGLDLPAEVAASPDAAEGPCRALLVDGTALDPCLLVRVKPGAEPPVSEQPAVTADPWPGVYDVEHPVVGGQLAAIEASDYAVPKSLVALGSSLTYDYRMGAWMPLLVSAGGEHCYLMEAHSSFFCVPERGIRGKDLDPEVCALPELTEHRKGRYVWGDAMRDRVTKIHARW